jgi:hypothetical protein
MCRFSCRRFILAISLPALSAAAAFVWVPQARAWSSQQQVFENQRISARLSIDNGHLSVSSIEDRAGQVTVKPVEAFVLVLKDGQEIRSSAMRLTSGPAESPLPAEPTAPRAAAQIAGRQMCANLEDAASLTQARWCILSRGDLPYLRQEVTIRARARPLPLADVQMFRFHDAAGRVLGTVPGSPVLLGNFYLGFEHPLSYATVTGGEIVAGLKRTLPLEAEQSIVYSSVIGLTRSGQMRRDFLAYLEMERAHPYRTFLHYNTWYDLGFGNRFSAAGVLDRMNAFGEELVQKRSVVMDSFLMDDGWDKTSSLWQFDSGFPAGFEPLRATAKQYGFGLGVWLSPWGGYSREKLERIAYGKSQGYEIVDGGYALSGPRYYAKFEEACLNFITRYGVNQFKLDGTGNAGQVFPGSIFDSDFSAAIHLIERVRQQDSQIFINLTTGTRPSPFWLRYTDSIWRGGEDHSFDGEGTWREKWITYRDEQIYRNIVLGGPLFPLNSLMLHGIIYAQNARHLSTDPGHDFAAEVHSYFGTGTQLQEMYITPSLLSSADWDVLAESARWSRKNAATLRDTHWIGGDPGKGEVYGWASWSTEKGILVLRNPTGQALKISIDVQQAFELADGAAQHYSAHSPWVADASKPAITLDGGHAHTFELGPFEVLTLDAQPQP